MRHQESIARAVLLQDTSERILSIQLLTLHGTMPVFSFIPALSLNVIMPSMLQLIDTLVQDFVNIKAKNLQFTS